MSTSTFRWASRPLRILDFDIEARPLSWINADFVSREVTAIGAKFIGDKRGKCWLLGTHDPVLMLEGFRELYEQADVVTGHYIRGYDLPTINSAMLDNGLPPLGPKLAQDTKNDLLKLQGLSKSQASLAETLGLELGKEGMSQKQWREANRLRPGGIRETRRRVMGDVEQHIQLRAALAERGWLSPPRVWRPDS